MAEERIVVRDEDVSITVVESEDGVHRAEIYRNALGEYSIHQTRRVSDGRIRVQVSGWDELDTLDDMVRRATHEIQTQLEIDAMKPNRHMDSVDGLDRHRAEMQRLATSGGERSMLEREGDALEAMERDSRAQDQFPPRSRICGHPTKSGTCSNRVTGSGPCAAGHPRAQK